MNHGREDQNPWAKWYWADFESDTGLRSCSLAAQGLWMRMLSIMAKSKRKGFLLDGANDEKQMESKTLAKLVGESVDIVDTLLMELESHGVYSKDDDGTIFNRRMLKEKTISEIRSESGRLGGRPKKQTKAKGENTKGPSAYASSSASISIFEDFWKAYPEEKGRRADAQKAFTKLTQKESVETIAAAFNGYMNFLKHKRIKENFHQKPMYAAKFLSDDRWREYIGVEYTPPL
jgi:hypothetical protein